MKVDLHVRHGSVAQAIQDYAVEKATRLDRYFDRILRVDVILEAGELCSAEMIAVLPRGAQLVGKAEGEDLQSVVDRAEGKLKRQIRRFHDKLRGHRDRSRAVGGTSPEEPA
ncbi:MAG: ribosome hibernation-promoting factor, HPF/YfiA family, partial [Planctomycetota bacterium]